jgi:hypothetical protein
MSWDRLLLAGVGKTGKRAKTRQDIWALKLQKYWVIRQTEPRQSRHSPRIVERVPQWGIKSVA